MFEKTLGKKAKRSYHVNIIKEGSESFGRSSCCVRNGFT
jgi:hypothetical protein